MRFRRRRQRPEPWVPEHDDDGYEGPATLVVGERELDVTVVLTGHLEPLDGRFHWYGRVGRNADVDAAKQAGATGIHLRLPGGEPTPGRLAEHDAWGNLRVTGVGAPPFALESVEVVTRT